MDGEIIITGHDLEVMKKNGYVEKHCPECGKPITITPKIVAEGTIYHTHCKETAIPVRKARRKAAPHRPVLARQGD